MGKEFVRAKASGTDEGVRSRGARASPPPGRGANIGMQKCLGTSTHFSFSLPVAKGCANSGMAGGGSPDLQ